MNFEKFCDSILSNLKVRTLHEQVQRSVLKKYLQKVVVDNNKFKYELVNKFTNDTIAEIGLNKSFEDKLHNIVIHVGVCANILLETSRNMSYVVDFLHLMRGREIAKNNANTPEERQSLYDAVVFNTSSLINSLLSKHSDSLVYFVDSTTSKFNSDVKSQINAPLERSRTIPKVTFRDLQNAYFSNPKEFFESIIRHPKSSRGELLRMALQEFFHLDLDEDVLEQKVSTTEIAKYIKALWQNSMEEPGTNRFKKLNLSKSDTHFFENLSWIMGEIQGPSHANLSRVGSSYSIPPSFSVFHKLPKAISSPSTVILVDDNLNRFNTYESINANIHNAFGKETKIIWVIGAGIEERIERYFSVKTA